MSRRKNNRKAKNVILSLMLIVAIGVTAAFAFLTASETSENLFTVGNVKIDLSEPKWDAANPDGILENITPGQNIVKDPTVTNIGSNDAYVYVMVEIPKVYQTDIVGLDGTVTTQEHYPLFSFEPNENWILLDSQTGTDTDAYDYYLYAYDASLAPAEASTLFDEVTFANITSDFVNIVTGEEIVDVNIRITAYGIQSDYYNDEATDAETAWKLYVNQNDWKWPENLYEGVATVNYLNEDEELVNSDYYYVGAPITMYFDNSLAKEGYSFDWVDIETNKVAYSGMKMPEDDLTLKADYTPYDTSVDAAGYFNYIIYGNSVDGYTATLYSADETSPLYPTTPTTVRVPAYLNVTGNGTITHSVKEANDYETYVPEFANEPNLSATEASHLWYGIGAEAINGTVSVPVTEVYHFDYNDDDRRMYYEANQDDMWEIIEPSYVPIGFQKVASTLATEIILPDTIEVIGEGSFGDVRHTATKNGTNTLQSIRLSYALTEVPAYAFSECQKLTEVDIPNSVTEIGDYAFFGCNELTEVTIPKTITRIGERAFSGWVTSGGSGGNGEPSDYYAPTRLTTVTFEEPSSITDIDAYAFAHCISLNNIKIPDTVTHIGESAIPCIEPDNWVDGYYIKDNCLLAVDFDIVNGPELKIPEGVVLVEDGAFFGCQSEDNITSLHIPSTLKYIYGTAIAILRSNLKEITVDENNEHFTAENGVLYNIDKTKLIFYPTQKTETEFTVPASVEVIGSYAFYNANNLKTVTMSDNVVEIGEWAFNNCRGLESIDLSDNLTVIGNSAFSYCTSLKSDLNLNNVTSMGRSAFNYCGLSNVQLSGDLECIPLGAFCNTHLEEIVIPEGVVEIGEKAFAGSHIINCLTLPKSLKIIKENAFWGTGNITRYVDETRYNGSAQQFYDITVEGGNDPIFTYVICNYDTEPCRVWKATDTVYGAWYDDTKTLVISGSGEMPNYTDMNAAPWNGYYRDATKVVIEDGITKIGDYAFVHFNKLNSVNIADSVTTIGNKAFYECSALSEFIGGNGIVSIAENAFGYDNQHLKNAIPYENGIQYLGNAIVGYDAESITGELVIKNGVTVIPKYAFECAEMTSVKIPSSVTSIESSAFAWCPNLKNITIPDSVTYIGECAFEGCPLLESVTLGKNVKKLDCSAFSSCINLKTVTLQEGLEYIGECAFYECYALDTVHIPSTVTEIASDAFTSNEEKTEMINTTIAAWDEMSDEEKAELEVMGITYEKLCSWSTTTTLCSTSETAYAKTYAEDNGFTFEICQH